MVRVVDS